MVVYLDVLFLGVQILGHCLKENTGACTEMKVDKPINVDLITVEMIERNPVSVVGKKFRFFGL
jgi:hypothetical protein